MVNLRVTSSDRTQSRLLADLLTALFNVNSSNSLPTAYADSRSNPGDRLAQPRLQRELYAAARLYIENVAR